MQEINIKMPDSFLILDSWQNNFNIWCTCVKTAPVSVLELSVISNDLPQAMELPLC